MLKNLSFEDLASRFPNEKFEYNIKNNYGKEILLIKKDKKIKLATIDNFDYCILNKMNKHIPIYNYNETLNITRQILSAYLFYISWFNEQKVISFYLQKIKRPTVNHQYPYILTKLHLKLDEFNQICVCPDIVIGNNDSFHITNYNNSVSLWSIATMLGGEAQYFDLNNLESSFNKLQKYLFDSYFKKHLQIEYNEFSSAHFDLLRMLLI